MSHFNSRKSTNHHKADAHQNQSFGSMQNLQSVQKENRLQELGRDLINQIFTYIRALQLYSEDNDIFLRPLQQMESNINEIISTEGKMRLFGDASTIYLNEKLIQFPHSFLPSVDFLLDTWSQRDIGGVSIDRYITAEQLRAYLQQFSPHQEFASTSLPHGMIRNESLRRIRASLQQAAGGGLAKLLEAKVDPQQYAMLLYSRLLQLVHKQWTVLSDDDHIIVNQMTRTLQELIDVCSTHKVLFLGFTNETDQRAYESYHICNTVFFSILFGQFLGLKRISLLKLSLAAIHHTIGKRWLPTSLLDKNQELSPQEQIAIRKIGVYTVQEILKGPFSWEKLQQALAIAGVYAAPEASKIQQTHSKDLNNPRYNATIQIGALRMKGPLLFSHILRLCSTFDSLCTRRPYRFKLFPAEALMKMRQHLDDRFDPYLLQRFIAFFSPMALHKQNNPRGQINPPPEKKSARAYGESLSPFGYGVRRQREQYWELRRLTNPTAEDRHKMSLLREWIDRKSDILGHMQNAQQATRQNQNTGNLTFSSIRAIQTSPLQDQRSASLTSSSVQAVRRPPANHTSPHHSGILPQQPPVRQQPSAQQQAPERLPLLGEDSTQPYYSSQAQQQSLSQTSPSAQQTSEHSAWNLTKNRRKPPPTARPSQVGYRSPSAAPVRATPLNERASHPENRGVRRSTVLTPLQKDQKNSK